MSAGALVTARAAGLQRNWTLQPVACQVAFGPIICTKQRCLGYLLIKVTCALTVLNTSVAIVFLVSCLAIGYSSTTHTL